MWLRKLRELLCRLLCGQPAASVCSNSDGALDLGSFIFVNRPRSGTRVSPGFTVGGCSRTFESNVPWRLLGSDGTVLAQGHTMGGGVDGPAGFTFTVDYTISTRQIGHLEVSAEDPSGGEGLPPPRNVIPVVLNP